MSSAPHWLQQHRLALLPVSRHLILLLNYTDNKGHFTPGSVYYFSGSRVCSRWQRSFTVDLIKIIFLSQHEFKLDFIPFFLLALSLYEGENKGSIPAKVHSNASQKPGPRPLARCQISDFFMKWQFSLIISSG